MNLEEFFNQDTFYWFCALLGTGMLFIQMMLNWFGIGEGESTDASLSDDAGQIKWISKQGIAGFLMMFGWTALTCQYEFGIEGILKIALAVGAGALHIVVTAKILNAAKKLHSSGTVFKIEDVIGLEASVYQRITADGIGKVTLSIDNFTREIDALSYDKVEIGSFTQVKIVKKFDNNTVLVVSI